jgi:NAD(P)H dehydrogenase (quinone)
MRIIVTGASGHFGRAATEGLLKRVPARDLILVSRDPRKLEQYAALGATVRQGDFDDASSLRAAFVGGEKMLFISGSRVGKRMPQHTNAVNEAVRAGVKHIVYTSFVGANPDNASLAVSDHRGTEALLRDSGVDWTAMRNSQYTDAIIEAAAPIALKSGRWIGSAGDGEIAAIARQDCVDAAVEVLTTPGHRNTVYNVTGPELLSYRKIAGIIAEVTGRPLPYQAVTDDDMYAMFDSLGIPREPVDDLTVQGVPWCSDDMVSFERTIRLGQFAVISNDFHKLTGRQPRSLRDFALERRDFLNSV